MAIGSNKINAQTEFFYQLPFEENQTWVAVGGFCAQNNSDRPDCTSGNHYDRIGGAVDFAPRSNMSWGEDTSNAWVVAAAFGTVTTALECYVVVAHENGSATHYLHLDNIRVKTGDRVLPNQRLGVIASTKAAATGCTTARADAPHLHFTVRPDTEGASFSGWTVSYDSQADRTSFTKGTQTRHLYDGLRSEYVPFYDLSPASPHFKAGQELARRLIASGERNGAFRPDDYITRAQVTKLLVRGMGHNTVRCDDNGERCTSIFTQSPSPIWWFTDVSADNTFFDEIRYLTAHPDDPELSALGITDQIIKGYEDRTFRPRSEITRAELASLIYRARVSLAETDAATCQGTALNFHDVKASSPHATAIEELSICGIVQGYQDDDGANQNQCSQGGTQCVISFRPDNKVTRAEAASMIYRGLVRDFTDSQCAQIGDTGLYDCQYGPENTLPLAPTSFSAAALDFVRQGDRYLITIFDQGINASLRLEIKDGATVLVSAEQIAADGQLALPWTAPYSGNFTARISNLNPFALEATDYRLRIDNITDGSTGTMHYTYSISPRENDSNTCGPGYDVNGDGIPDNYIKLWASPNNGDTSSVTLRMSKCNTCDGCAFGSGGTYLGREH